MIPGKSIYLRAVETTDLEACVRWMNDREVTRFLNVTAFPVSRLAEEAWLERASRAENPAHRHFAICLEGTGRHIGNAGLHGIDWPNRVAELGIMIGEKDCWSRGYGTDVVATLLDFAFREINLRKVFLRVFSHNPRAIRCYEKCGFQTEGRLREQVWIDGGYVDEIIMAVFAPPSFGSGGAPRSQSASDREG